MTDNTVHIASSRLLFRKTFMKLLAVLDPDLRTHEHAVAPGSLQQSAEFIDAVKSTDTPGSLQQSAEFINAVKSADTLLILDLATSSAEQVDECMLALLSVNACAAIVVVLDELQDAAVDAAMHLGAMGVIVKASAPQVIISALQRILAGERCRPAPVVDIAREQIPESLRRQLSARQQKMLRAIIGGQSISATARQLNITPARLVSDMREVVATMRGRGSANTDSYS